MQPQRLDELKQVSRLHVQAVRRQLPPGSEVNLRRGDHSEFIESKKAPLELSNLMNDAGLTQESRPHGSSEPAGLDRFGKGMGWPDDHGGSFKCRTRPVFGTHPVVTANT